MSPCDNIRQKKPCEATEREPPLTLPEDCLVCEAEMNAEKADNRVKTAHAQAAILGNCADEATSDADDVQGDYDYFRFHNEHESEHCGVCAAKRELDMAHLKAKSSRFSAAVALAKADIEKERAVLARMQISSTRKLEASFHARASAAARKKIKLEKVWETAMAGSSEVSTQWLRLMPTHVKEGKTGEEKETANELGRESPTTWLRNMENFRTRLQEAKDEDDGF